MDYRRASSIAGFVLLIGASGGLLAPAARAGDRIEFSAPTIPLAIPQPDVEIKEPSKPISSANLADGPTYDADFLPPPQITVTKARTKERDPWNASPLQSDLDPRASDDLFNARQDASRLTNGSPLGMHRAWEANDAQRMLLRKGDAKFGDDANASRFGMRNGWDKDNGRDGDLFGRDSSNKKNQSSLLKMFSLDPASSDRISAWAPKSFLGESETLTGVGSEQLKFKLGMPSDSERTPTLTPGYGSYNPTDKRQIDQQAGTTPGYLRAWEPAGTHTAAPKRTFDPNHPDLSHVVAPNRPVNLPMPKRPSDPNPY